jgi:D-glucosaminate-6-phosphate ammonia-lyase
MSIYEKLGTRPVLNAAGTLTRLGGSLMAPEVVAAMDEAAQASVDMFELQAAASRAIAAATGAEAGMVTTGASAGLTLAAASCIAGFDAARMDRLPHTDGMPNEIVMLRAHRNAYDHALRAAGAVIVDVGLNDRATGAGVRGVEGWEIDAAVTPRTVAVAYAAIPGGRPALKDVVAAAKGLPVIVDAAAQLPPKTNLRRFIDEGAALVAFSGGKAIGGPQASGILAGRRDLIASALLQQLDMDVNPAEWAPPAELFPKDKLRGIPHHGIGRGFKASKEAIAGLLVALDRFVARDEEAEMCRRTERLNAIAKVLVGLNGVTTRVVPIAETGRVPLLELRCDPAALGCATVEIGRRLRQGMPSVHLGEGRAADDILSVDLSALRQNDDAALAQALQRALVGR